MKNTDTVKRTVNNAFFILIARASELVSGLLIIVLISRYLGVKDFGIYAFITAVSLMLAPVIQLGSSRIIIREISVNRNQTSGFVTSGFILNVCMSLLALLISALIAVIFNLSSAVYIIALSLAILTQTLSAMAYTFKAVFIAYEKAVYNSVTTALTRLLAIISIFFVIRLDMGFIYLFMALTAVSAFGACFSFYILHFQIAKIKLEVNLKLLKYLYKETFPIAISVFFAQGFAYTNVFLLKIFHDVVQISFFQAPQRIITPSIIMYGAAMLAFFPMLARASANNAIDDLKYILTKMIKYTIILTIPICLCVTVFASKITLLLFGNQFAGATVPFQILTWLIIPAFINFLLVQMLTVIKKQRVLITTNGIGYFINLMMGLALVNKYASVGICWASLFSYIALAMVNFYCVSKYLGLIPMHKIILRPLIAGSVMWGFLYQFADKVNIVPFIIGSFVIYCSSLFLLKTFSRDEIDIFKVGFFQRSGNRPAKRIK